MQRFLQHHPRLTTQITQIESAFKDIDYRGKIKRSQFEAAASDLMVRFALPLHTCLAKAGIAFVCFQLIHCHSSTHPSL